MRRRGFVINDAWDRWLYVVGGAVFFVFFGLVGVGILWEGPRDPARAHAALQGMPEAPAWGQYLSGMMSLVLSLGGLWLAAKWWRRKA
ncbi:MAG: hypothetical protein AAFY08_01610 [Planctomycetota bacterium]